MNINCIRALVNQYNAYDRRGRDDEINRFATMGSLNSAIHHAAMATAPSKRDPGTLVKHPHQISLDPQSMRSGKMVLARLLKNRGLHVPGAAQTFDAVHEAALDAVTEVRRKAKAKGASIPGKRIRTIGELWAYDTAMRVGTYMGRAPTVVHLHAGVRKAVENLRLPHADPAFIRLSELPQPIADLGPLVAENFLCVYADELLSCVRRS